jgi:dethiobiotin synthetase
MQSLGFPVVVVARPGLGTLNHTLLTLDALRQRGLRVLGVVVNQAMPGRMGWIEKDNVNALRVLGKVPILACVPFRK